MNYIELALLLVPIVLLLMASIITIIRRPYDITQLAVLTSIVFILFPGILFYTKSGFIEIVAFPIIPLEEEIVYALLFLTGYSFFLFLGSSLAVGYIELYSRYPHGENTTIPDGLNDSSPMTKRDRIVIIGALCCFGYLFSVIFASKGLSLTQFFLPARYEMHTSNYVEILYRLLPLSVAIVYTLKERRFTLIANLFFLIALIAAISLAQRRDIIVVLLSILALNLVFSKSLNRQGQGLVIISRDKLKYIRKLSIYLLIFIVLIPVLWYMRSISTAIVRDHSAWTSPWESRGAVELLLRSPGIGFESFIAIRRMIDECGPIPAYSFIYPLYVWIPRALWPQKPIGPQGIVVDYYGLKGFPSIFLPGDLYINFGPYLLWLGAVLVGFVLTYISLKAYYKKNLFSEFLWIATFSNLPTLIKNGIAAFFGLFGLTLVLLLIISYFAKVGNRYSIVFSRKRPV